MVLPLPQILPDPPGVDPAVLAAQAAANTVSVGSLAGVSPPPPFHPIPGAPPLPAHPGASPQVDPWTFNYPSGGAAGVPPHWLQGLVDQFRQAPTDRMWRHLMLGEGVGSQYAGFNLPPWLRAWLAGAMGREPTDNYSLGRPGSGVI
jgi:hypothetical protein